MWCMYTYKVTTHLIITSHDVNKIEAHLSKGIIYVWKMKGLPR